MVGLQCREFPGRQARIAGRHGTALRASLAGAAASIIFVATNTKDVFCRNKGMLAETKLLSQQNYVCCDEVFLSQQRFCRDKHTFDETEDVFCRDRHGLVMTKVSVAKMVFVATKKNVCRDKHTFVATKIILVAAPAKDIGAARRLRMSRLLLVGRVSRVSASFTFQSSLLCENVDTAQTVGPNA